ncbi:hypothetical protein EX30DRAFT_337346, partial [Ascodesmis nigricans]
MAPGSSITDDNFKFIMACVNAANSIDYNTVFNETGMVKDAAYKKLWALRKKYPVGGSATTTAPATPTKKSTGKVTKSSPTPKKGRKKASKKELDKKLEELGGEERDEDEKTVKKLLGRKAKGSVKKYTPGPVDGGEEEGKGGVDEKKPKMVEDINDGD